MKRACSFQHRKGEVLQSIHRPKQSCLLSQLKRRIVNVLLVRTRPCKWTTRQTINTTTTSLPKSSCITTRKVNISSEKSIDAATTINGTAAVQPQSAECPHEQRDCNVAPKCHQETQTDDWEHHAGYRQAKRSLCQLKPATTITLRRQPSEQALHTARVVACQPKRTNQPRRPDSLRASAQSALGFLPGSYSSRTLRPMPVVTKTAMQNVDDYLRLHTVHSPGNYPLD